ncbi:hypothetical protein [Deinococcus cellulosilyticus]|uniref:Uncharacterized protein n=1 Tax=Deinococcus cellulosilyticus (strain DSM 18568 / NBRC 106333 / KACC 11606 / 5516J-15) TaxID=1223518 RepID=A0A511N740_DEIC1|nr:hypothetical protein [Deinococcus cellulosilyticus]GEM48663.1 hypothetical protein DC3_42980 [Deinococcus cellulosilyticus NBRC 106333 = KACC 11606]
MLQKLKETVTLIRLILAAALTAISFVEVLSESDGSTSLQKKEKALKLLKSSFPVEKLPLVLRPYADTIYGLVIEGLVDVANSAGVFKARGGTPQVPCASC